MSGVDLHPRAWQCRPACGTRMNQEALQDVRMRGGRRAPALCRRPRRGPVPSYRRRARRWRRLPRRLRAWDPSPITCAGCRLAARSIRVDCCDTRRSREAPIVNVGDAADLTVGPRRAVSIDLRGVVEATGALDACLRDASGASGRRGPGSSSCVTTTGRLPIDSGESSPRPCACRRTDAAAASLERRGAIALARHRPASTRRCCWTHVKTARCVGPPQAPRARRIVE